MKLLWSYIKQHRGILWGTLGLATVNQVFSLLDPQIFRLIVDNYVGHIHELPQATFLRGVLLLLGASVGVAFVSRVAKNFQDYYVNVITQRVGARLYAHSVAHSFSLPYAVFEDQRSGELLQKLNKARADAQVFITSIINVAFVSLVGMVFVLVYAFTVQWLVGLTYVLIIPTLGVTSFAISRRIKQAQARIVAQTAELAGSTTETLRNVELVKSLGLDEQETLRLNRVNEQILELELKKVKLIRKLSFVQGTVINALRSSIMLLMLWYVFQGGISLGQFFSLLFYSFFLFQPLSEFGTVTANYQEASASLDKLEEILQLKPEVKPANPKPTGTISHLSFTNVSFSYASAANTSLEGVNLEVNRGETVAFVGPSGSGKTTLVKLLVSLYQPTSGQVSVNGIPSNTIDVDELRRHIGYVSQETQLFAGTIRENLLFVRPEATDGDCLKALDQAQAQSILERGKQGLDTRIGEAGIKLSGGERQRLAIARALLRNPDLIIFDEATSSLDSITERAITATIRAISSTRPNLMTVLVAHRLSTVAHADRIYVLERGQVVELGKHAELVAQPGLYAALWREQSSTE